MSSLIAASSPPWRVIRDGAGEAAWNMALDEALLESVAANEAPPTIRLYRWKRASITLGRFQDVRRSLHPNACKSLGVPIVRRITGGRGILHGDDLTVSIAAPIAALNLNVSQPCRISAIYERLAQGFIAAFAAIGIEAVSGACQRGSGREARGDCFATVSRADIVEAHSGKKLLGSALYRRDGWILQQTSVPLFPLLSAAALEAHREHCANLFCGTQADYPKLLAKTDEVGLLERAVIAGLEAALAIRTVCDEVSQQEYRRAGGLVDSRYQQTAWTTATSS